MLIIRLQSDRQTEINFFPEHSSLINVSNLMYVQEMCEKRCLAHDTALNHHFLWEDGVVS